MRSSIPKASFLFSKTPKTFSKTGFLTFFLSFIASVASTLAWKITDVDFATKMGAKSWSYAYGCIALFLILAGIGVAVLRKSRSSERIFIRIQQISLCFFLFLWLIEMQFDISSIPLGVFALKVIGHIYSSVTILTFWIMYDPYDPFCRISQPTYTMILTAAYIGIAFSGVVVNFLPHTGVASFIPLLSILSFIVWFVSNLCHPKAAERTFQQNISTKIEPVIFSDTPELSKKRRFSRSTLFLIIGSIALNSITSSSEYAVIADFESQFFEHEGGYSFLALGQFLTIFGLGNLIALISCTIWYNVRLSPVGLMIIGALAICLAQCSPSIALVFPNIGEMVASWMNPAMMTAAGSLFIVESLYPIVVQSNMTNVLAALPITIQRQARAIIESSAEALGLIVSVIIMESTISLVGTIVSMCLFLCTVSGFLLLKQQRRSQISDKIVSDSEESLAQESDQEYLFKRGLTSEESEEIMNSVIDLSLDSEIQDSFPEESMVRYNSSEILTEVEEPFVAYN